MSQSVQATLQLLDTFTRPDFHIFLHNLFCLYLGFVSGNEVSDTVVRCSRYCGQMVLRVGEIQIYKRQEYCRSKDQAFCSIGLSMWHILFKTHLDLLLVVNPLYCALASASFQIIRYCAFRILTGLRHLLRSNDEKTRRKLTTGIVVDLLISGLNEAKTNDEETGYTLFIKYCY